MHDDIKKPAADPTLDKVRTIVVELRSVADSLEQIANSLSGVIPTEKIAYLWQVCKHTAEVADALHEMRRGVENFIREDS